MGDIKSLYVWRQNYIILTLITMCINIGIIMSFASAINPAVLAPNATDIRATPEEATWIASLPGVGAIPPHIFMPVAIQRFGRKPTFIISNIVVMIRWIVLLFAQNIPGVLSGRFIQGFGVGHTISSIILTAEYAHPNRRGYFMAIKKFTMIFGVLLCHVLNMCWSWRQIGILAVSFNVMTIIMMSFWPESPAFLAMKNRFEECEKSFIWLHGKDSSNKKELVDLITSQEEKSKEKKVKKTVKYYIQRLCKRDFLLAFFISILLQVLIETSGRHVFASYIIDIMLDLLGDKSAAMYVTLGNDLLTLAGLFIAIIIIQHFNRRTLIFTFGGLGVVMMFVVSAILISKSSYPSANLGLWSAISIMLFSFLMNIGVVPIAFAVMGEVFSLDLRGIGVSIIGTIFLVLMTVVVKVSPALICYIGLSGTFLLNACVTITCLVFLHFVLPETKDRTLLDIEKEIKGKTSTCTEIKPMLQVDS